MANRWWVVLLAGALAITGCQNCGSLGREAEEATAKQAEEAATAKLEAAEREARAATERAAAEEAARGAAEREAAAQAAAAAAAARGHTVVAGDCLWTIAEERWNDGLRWPEIHEANSDLIEDPDLIYPGQVLSLSSG